MFHIRRLYSFLFCVGFFGGSALIHAELPAKLIDHVRQTQPQPKIASSSVYAKIIEKLLFYKDDRFSVFYGGPIHHDSDGVRWLMFAVFEDENYQTRSCYEFSFVRCDLNDAKNAEILFVDAPDINIKFKNELSKDYTVFSDLCSGKYSPGKYIVVRSSDVAMPFYPNIYIASHRGPSEQGDKKKIVQFLHSHFKTKKSFKDYYKSTAIEEISFETDEEITFKPIPLEIDLFGKKKSFYLVKKILPNDPWKLYYIISCDPKAFTTSSVISEKSSDMPFVRLDSGCLSGQIYGDGSCDCLDQLHTGLDQISESSTQSYIIHMPTHDGRGFGSAPKAETEIYKKGGRGRVHATNALDTITAAQYLYDSEYIDLRTFDGAAILLKNLGLQSVALFTDNRMKVESLENHGINIVRVPTGTMKESCAKHLESKKNSEAYYKD